MSALETGCCLSRRIVGVSGCCLGSEKSSLPLFCNLLLLTHRRCELVYVQSDVNAKSVEAATNPRDGFWVRWATKETNPS